MPRLPVRMKLAYGASDFGFSMAGTIVMFFLLVFVVQVVGLKPWLAGLALAIGKVWDAIVDPFIGHLSDRTRTRWGRRRPFFLWFALPYGASFILIWLLPPMDNQWLLAAIFGLLNLLFITFFSLLMVPYNALGPEMTRDYDDRTSLTSYRMAFSIVAGLAASVLPIAVIASFGGNARLGYAVMGLVFGVSITLFPLFAFFGTREEGDAPAGAPSLSAGLKAAATNKPFLYSLAAYLANWVAIDVIGAVFLFYTQFCLRLSLAESNPVLAILFVSAFLFLPLWVKIAKIWSKKTAYILGLGYLGAILAVFAFFVPAQLWLIYILAAAAGLGVSAAHVIPLSIIPDAVEYDVLRTGEDHEGVYFGLLTFLQQLASAGGIFLVGVFLDAFGFDRRLAVQTASAQLGIRLALGALPGFLLALGILAISFYPITRAAHAGIVAELARRRAGREMNL
ncbi:MAG: MFS transporter [Patescibacteria group bacterium]